MMMVNHSLAPRERFIAALQRRPLPGRVPHFELVFFLTMQVFGKVHPDHRNYSQWLQMTETERSIHRRDMAQIFVDIAQRYEHDAIYLLPNPDDLQETIHLINHVRDISGDRYFLMVPGDATYAIPDGQSMEELSLRMAEHPQQVEDDAKRNVDQALQRAEHLKKHSALDGFALCSDYCFNTGTFLPLSWFDRFVTPHLIRLVSAYREMGFYVIKHTDGNIMPILDRLLEANPHALHSLDPQGGIDMAQMVAAAGDRVALCGNVNCGLMQTGSDAQCVQSAQYALRHGMTAPGYIFCTSNCIYTGMPLERYELIWNIWRHEGVRDAELTTSPLGASHRASCSKS